MLCGLGIILLEIYPCSKLLKAVFASQNNFISMVCKILCSISILHLEIYWHTQYVMLSEKCRYIYLGWKTWGNVHAADNT